MNTKTLFLLASVSLVMGTFADPCAASVISGFVFIDSDMDGDFDFWSERVLPNVPIRLTETTGTGYSVDVFTDENGRFVFDDLVAGVYDVTQIRILPQYVTVTVDVGTLFDVSTNRPIGSGYGMPQQYSQSRDILPGIVSIVIPDDTTRGINYNFGQIWWGKFMYLGEPPGNPPGSIPLPPEFVPEPTTVSLLLFGAMCLLARRRKR